MSWLSTKIFLLMQIGSTEWVEQNSDLLFSEAIAYINVDTAVMGSGFFASSTPQLDDLLYEITKKVVIGDSYSFSQHIYNFNNSTIICFLFSVGGRSRQS